MGSDGWMENDGRNGRTARQHYLFSQLERVSRSPEFLDIFSRYLTNCCSIFFHDTLTGNLDYGRCYDGTGT